MSTILNRLVAIVLLLAVVTTSSAAEKDEATKPLPSLSALALQLLDSEALYTVSGGLKPVSEGFLRLRVSKEQDLGLRVEEMRILLSQLPLGVNFETGVIVFSQSSEEFHYADAFVAHRPSLIQLLRRRQDVFQSIGVNESHSAQQIMNAINQAPAASLRWKAYGLVFGYPDHAVDFFVAAGERQKATGLFVERDFFQIPTFGAEKGQFVYAVPKSYVPQPIDLQLRARAMMILGQYKATRSSYIEIAGCRGETLLREWVRCGTWTPDRASLACCSPRAAHRQSLARYRLRLLPRRGG